MESTSISARDSDRSVPVEMPAAARAVLKHLEAIRHGSLSLVLPDNTVKRFGTESGAHATLRLHNWRLLGEVLRSGDVGMAEAFIRGDWSTPDLTMLLTLLLRNRPHLESLIHGSWWGGLLYRLRHRLNRNSRSNSRKNIHAHYDLGNAFYGLWLDPTSNYSSAWFESFDLSMEEAQHAKVRRALSMAGVRPGDRLLEIGCGWGALAEKAATEFDASVVGVTLSTEQLAFARSRLQSVGAAGRADLRLQDYRDIADGPFDAICSIEMVEAVGREYWPAYFEQVSRLLKTGGRACVQSIVIADAHFDRYVSGTDFIQQYIFPGGCLPSPGAFRAEAAKAGLDVVDELYFGQDYARTLRYWRERFESRRADVLALGFDTRFLRIWEFYLAYCEAAFQDGSTDVVQFTLHKRA